MADINILHWFEQVNLGSSDKLSLNDIDLEAFDLGSLDLDPDNDVDDNDLADDDDRQLGQLDLSGLKDLSDLSSLLG